MNNITALMRIICLMVLLSGSFIFGAAAQKTDKRLAQQYFTNPILKGFHPDPSICRVGTDYYLVTSSFEYYPGVPIYHSKDLINWQQIGHVLSRPTQLDLDTVMASGGIWAPTLRYFKGTYYVITTMIGKKGRGSFYVTSTSPYGPWSEPNWLPITGIDPSFFFDDDSKTYITGQKDSRKQGINQIWIQQIDLGKKVMSGDRVIIYEGPGAEGSHLYKKGNSYYLLVAEGGTGTNHAEIAAKSQNITGPYLAYGNNPIITHRNLVNDPISSTGHADLVETQFGDWWMVLLGRRVYGNSRSALGRETFLTPVSWEDNWPLVNYPYNKILLKQQAPSLPPVPLKLENPKDDFSSDSLFYYWNFLRTPRTKFYSLNDRSGYLRLYLQPESINQKTSPAFIGRRQEDISCTAEVSMDFKPINESEAAGLVVLANNDNYFFCEKTLLNGEYYLQVIKRNMGSDEVVDKTVVDNGRLTLAVKILEHQCAFYYSKNGKLISLGPLIEADNISKVRFTGTYIGMYCSSKGRQSTNFADFDYFDYKRL